MEYEIFRAANADELCQIVQRVITQGLWKPLGAPFTGLHFDGELHEEPRTMFYQAMTRG